MGIGRKLLISIITLFSMYGVYLWGIPYILNLPSRVPQIEQHLRQDYGVDVSLKNPVLRMCAVPGVNLSVDEIKLFNKDNTEAFVANDSEVTIKLLPLLFNKVVIDRFEAQNIRSNLSLNKNSKLMIGDYEIPDVQLSKTKIYLRNIITDTITVRFFDEKYEKEFLYKGNNLKISDFSPSHLKLYLDSTLESSGKTTVLNFDIDTGLPLNVIDENQFYLNINIQNLDLSMFSRYAKILTNGEIKSLSGVVDVKTVTTVTDKGSRNIVSNIIADKLLVKMKDEVASIFSENELKIISNINTIKNGFAINFAQIISKGIDLNLNGNITRITSKNPNVDLKININKSRIENFIPLLPGARSLVPEVDLYELKKYPFYGEIVGNLDVHGNFIEPDIYGPVVVSDAYLLNRLSDVVKGADIKLSFIKDKIELDVTVPTDLNETVFVKGYAGFYGEKLADLYIESTQNIDLKKAQSVLNPLHRILTFLIGPVPIMDINGIGNIDLHVYGSKKKPHGFGQFNFKDAKVSFNDIPDMVIEKVAGYLKFNDEDTYFENTSGNLNGHPVKVSGHCSLYGVLDYKVVANNQNLADLLKIIKSSPMFVDLHPMISPVKYGEGPINLKLNIFGEVPDINEMIFNKNIFAIGSLNLLSNKIYLNGLRIPLEKTKGVINFENNTLLLKLSSLIGSSKIFTDGKIIDNIAEMKILSENFKLGDAYAQFGNLIKLPLKNDFLKIKTQFTANYKGPVDKVDLNKVNLQGKVFANKDSEKLFIKKNADYTVSNGLIKLSPVSGAIDKIPYELSLSIVDAFSNKFKINGYFKMQGFNIGLLSNLEDDMAIPENIRKELSYITDAKGSADISAFAKNNNFRLYTTPHDMSFVYAPAKMLIKLNSGNISMRNDILYLNKLNSYIGEMPVLLDGKIQNILKKPYFDVYVNAKPSQEFFDQFYNNRALYPIKIKGDILSSSRFIGTSDNIHSKISLEVAENSSFYYMGASIGGPDKIVKIYLDSVLTPLKFKVNDFSYSNLIESQNNKIFEMPMLKSSGSVKMIDEKNVVFEDFKIKTENPTDAKIFNIFFRKPLMKQGLFSSDLVFNGNIFAPKIRGDVDFTSIDVPFYDSTIKDIHINFTPEDVLLKSKSIVLTNEIDFSAKIKNDFKPPFVLRDVNLNLADLDINKITGMIRNLELDSQRNRQVAGGSGNVSLLAVPYLSEFRIQNAEIVADKIRVKNINAENFVANLSLNENMLLDVDKFKFNLANGTIDGDMQYNLLSNKLNLSLDLKDADALIMSEALFDLQGQIFGNVTGDINLSCDGKSQEVCTKTLVGAGHFVVRDGKMPKLGSLEYLLRAGNLMMGGIRGLSINGIIDLVTPLKTGEFSDISGNIAINNGLIDTINIYSRGRDLNMYLTGSYDILSAFADMQIYGNLSRNMSTVFGKIKNASLNTLLNTIPFMNKTDIDEEIRVQIDKIPNTNVDSNESRIFAVEVEGDINGDAYVKSFKWIK